MDISLMDDSGGDLVSRPLRHPVNAQNLVKGIVGISKFFILDTELSLV